MVDYAPGLEERKVDVDDWFCFKGQAYKAGRAFAGQTVGLRPTQKDGILEVLFATQVIKRLEPRLKTL